MKQFAVSVRPLGGLYHVGVEGMANANWLLTQLSRSFLFRNAEPIRQDYHTSCCTFRVPYDSRMSVQRIRRLLDDIPEVRLAPEEQVQTAPV